MVCNTCGGRVMELPSGVVWVRHYKGCSRIWVELVSHKVK